MKKLLAATAIFSLIAGNVQAQVVRTTENGRDVIYSRGHTAGTPVQMGILGGTTPRAILANSCGIVRVSASQATPDSININGIARSIANPVSLSGTPVCNGSTPPWEGGATSAARRDPSGNFYFSGYTPNQAATVAARSSGSRNVTANGCGIARFAESAEGNPWGNDFSFTIGGTNYTLGSVTSQNYGPICRNVGTSGSPTYLIYEAAN